MSDIKFYVSLDDLNDARQEYYLQGIIQGEANIEKLRSADNKAWKQIVIKLRELCEANQLTESEIEACWPDKYGKIYEGKSSEPKKATT